MGSSTIPRPLCSVGGCGGTSRRCSEGPSSPLRLVRLAAHPWRPLRLLLLVCPPRQLMSACRQDTGRALKVQRSKESPAAWFRGSRLRSPGARDSAACKVPAAAQAAGPGTLFPEGRSNSICPVTALSQLLSGAAQGTKIWNLTTKPSEQKCGLPLVLGVRDGWMSTQDQGHDGFQAWLLATPLCADASVSCTRQLENLEGPTDCSVVGGHFIIFPWGGWGLLLPLPGSLPLSLSLSHE